MKCTSCPGKDRKLLVIADVSALFVLEKMYSNCRGLVVLIFSLQFRFGRIPKFFVTKTVTSSRDAIRTKICFRYVEILKSIHIQYYKC